MASIKVACLGSGIDTSLVPHLFVLDQVRTLLCDTCTNASGCCMHARPQQTSVQDRKDRRLYNMSILLIGCLVLCMHDHARNNLVREMALHCPSLGSSIAMNEFIRC